LECEGPIGVDLLTVLWLLSANRSMKQRIGYVALVVRDYDEAIDFHVNGLGFTLVEDRFSQALNKRWVLIAPAGSLESRLFLARAVGTSNHRGLEIKLAAACSSFYTLMPSGVTSAFSGRVVLSSCANRKRKATAQSLYSRIYTKICATLCN
jgi:hypothetical protein